MACHPERSEGSMQSTHKPFPLIASTLWWIMQTTAGLVYATYIDFHLGHTGEEKNVDLAVLALLFFVTCALLWFLWSYWQGHDWTRTLVMIGLVVKLGYYGVSLYHLRHFPYNLGRQVLFSVRIVDMFFSAYIFTWLLTKEARHYFAWPRTDWESIDQRPRSAL
jgi:hypothetical protein